MPRFKNTVLTLALLSGSIVSSHAQTPPPASAPGATANDTPWLKLGVASRRGSGILANVTTVQRINTRGGKRDGACDAVGSFASAPYSAGYVLPRKS